PDVDDVLLDDKRGRDRGLGGLVRTARRLRRERFDVVVSPHRSLRTALILAAARIPRRIGFRESRGALLYHERVPRDRRRHDVERNLALLRPFGPPPAGPPVLHVPVSAEAATRPDARGVRAWRSRRRRLLRDDAVPRVRAVGRPRRGRRGGPRVPSMPAARRAALPARNRGLHATRAAGGGAVGGPCGARDGRAR